MDVDVVAVNQDWEEVKEDVMRKALVHKFTQVGTRQPYRHL